MKVTIEKKDVSEAVEDSDLIIAQSLPKGTKVKSGDSIILYVPNLLETIPDMVKEGWTQDEADAFCVKYGLTMKIKTQETTIYDEGVVIAQSLRAGSTITKGSTLTVTIATKPKETPTPKPTVTPEPSQDTE